MNYTKIRKRIAAALLLVSTSHLSATNAQATNTNRAENIIFQNLASMMIIMSPKPNITNTYSNELTVLINETKALLEANGNIVNNKASYYYNTSILTFAASLGLIDFAKSLIIRRADVNSVDDFGNTPLMAASTKSHWKMVDLLLKNKADVTRSNKKHKTALSLARISLEKNPNNKSTKETIKLLVAAFLNKDNNPHIIKNPTAAALPLISSSEFHKGFKGATLDESSDADLRRTELNAELNPSPSDLPEHKMQSVFDESWVKSDDPGNPTTTQDRVEIKLKKPLAK